MVPISVSSFMCTRLTVQMYKPHFTADQVALRKEAEKRAKRKLTEDNHRGLLYNYIYQFIINSLVQHLREELDRRIAEKKKSKV